MSAIVIQSYNVEWPLQFEKEKERILFAAKNWVLSIEHVGSTAVPLLPAKPTIDMCMVLSDLELANQHIIPAMQKLGYQYLPELEKTIPDRRYVQRFNEKGEHIFHVHMVLENSKRHVDYLLFRDYLRSHPEKIKEYATLKKELQKNFSHNREQYTEGKAQWIQRMLQEAAVVK